jgi:hypothetical protein
MDTRHYTDCPWGGYFYCDGVEDAMEKYRIIREAVDKHLPNGVSVPVIVKRSCTEFEREHGPTDGDFWQGFPSVDADFQRHVEDIFGGGDWNWTVQPDWMRNKTLLKWAHWANMWGDKTWKDVTHIPDFTVNAVTYHRSKEDVENATSKTSDLAGKKTRPEQYPRSDAASEV